MDMPFSSETYVYRELGLLRRLYVGLEAR
jgi:hypothetical protein